MKYLKTKDQGVQNYTHMSKIKYLWVINLVLFIAVVFLGIEQAGRGAEISHLEDKIEVLMVSRRELTEQIFSAGSSLSSIDNAQNLGFIKPNNVHYLKAENIFAKLPVQ